MTMVYGGMFFLAGAVLLVTTFSLVAEALDDRGTPEGPLSVVEGAAPAAKDEWATYAEKLRTGVQQDTLESMVTQGVIALGLVGVGVMWLGWLTAKRSLRPLQRITATARRVAERNLSERIGMIGPRDELRELADTFDSMLERLARSFDSHRRFVANASHELRTPLAINRTVLELAIDRPDASTDLRETATLLLDVNTRQERLIEGLLTLARADGTLPDRHPVDLAEIATRVVDQARTEAAELGVELRTSSRRAPTTGSAVLLERLVQNLVQNAVRYNERGGWVELSVHSRREGVRLVVTNTGPAIAHYEVPGLFEPFRRLTDRVGSARGTGLGLSIVQAVARTHDGDVTAEPRAGGGLIVRVELPAET